MWVDFQISVIYNRLNPTHAIKPTMAGCHCCMSSSLRDPTETVWNVAGQWQRGKNAGRYMLLLNFCENVVYVTSHIPLSKASPRPSLTSQVGKVESPREDIPVLGNRYPVFQSSLPWSSQEKIITASSSIPLEILHVFLVIVDILIVYMTDSKQKLFIKIEVVSYSVVTWCLEHSRYTEWLVILVGLGRIGLNCVMAKQCI